MSKILSGDSAADFQKWQAPSVSEAELSSTDGQLAPPIPPEELEAIHQQAHAKGYQMGRWEGMQAGREELQAQSERFDELMNSFADPMAQLDEKVQRELVLLAGVIAGQLIYREIKQDPEVLNSIVSNAVNALQGAPQRVDVQLCPSDLTMARDVLQSPDPDQKWHLVEDPSLKPGDVRVVAKDAFVDAGLRTRLHALVAEILNEPSDDLSEELPVFEAESDNVSSADEEELPDD